MSTHKIQTTFFFLYVSVRRAERFQTSMIWVDQRHIFAIHLIHCSCFVFVAIFAIVIGRLWMTFVNNFQLVFIVFARKVRNEKKLCYYTDKKEKETPSTITCHGNSLGYFQRPRHSSFHHAWWKDETAENPMKYTSPTFIPQRNDFASC